MSEPFNPAGPTPRRDAVHAVVEAQGHLIDSQLMTAIFDRVIGRGGTFEVLQFDIGRTNDEFSRLKLKVGAPDEATLTRLLEDLMALGCHSPAEQDATLRPAERVGCVPDDFYSTTNDRTAVRHNGRWLEVGRQRMDAVIVVEEDQSSVGSRESAVGSRESAVGSRESSVGSRESSVGSRGSAVGSPQGEGDRAMCRKLRDVRPGDRVVCGVYGIRVFPAFRERDRLGFTFMSNDVSSERRVEVGAARVASMMREARATGGRIVWVAGPVVVHTGGTPYFRDLLAAGYVDALLAGNALAVHDIEGALYGTSLGIDLEAGSPVDGGHRHHMRAINTIARAGGIREAVEQGVLRSGIMYDCVTRGIPYVLAGSIRDDGPLPDTVMDLVEAQDRYAAALEGAGLVLILSTMLHGIGVANMLPSWVRGVCVDINPAVVTKLADRGSPQMVGLVTDVGMFLHQLARQLA